MKELTLRQSQVLNYIKEYITQYKFPPTIREVSRHFAISTRAAYDHMKALEKKQFLRWRRMQRRAIEVVDFPAVSSGETRVPIIGGQPMHHNNENSHGSFVSMSNMFLSAGTYFALHVQGDSMIDAGIMAGDLAIIREKDSAENGDIIATMLNNLLTLKRYFRESNRIRLEADNHQHSVIYTQDIKILGRLAHIIRNY